MERRPRPAAVRQDGIEGSVGPDAMHDVTRVLVLLIAGWCGLSARRTEACWEPLETHCLSCSTWTRSAK